MTDKSLPALIADVSATLARLEKRGTAPQAMGAFRFVRETDVIEALKPELDSRGIVLRPDVELLRLDTFERQGKDMPNTVATVSLALWAIRGAEEYLISRTVGQGADTQDKAVGKAVTSAKKQAFLIAFAIPTGDDPDAHAIPERSPRRTEQPGRGVSPSRDTGPVPAPVTYRRAELAKLLVDKGMDHVSAEQYADLIGIPKDERPMSDASMDRLIEAVRGHGTAEPLELPLGGAEPAAEPPKPGTDEYKALSVTERAYAKAHWTARGVPA